MIKGGWLALIVIMCLLIAQWKFLPSSLNGTAQYTVAELISLIFVYNKTHIFVCFVLNFINFCVATVYEFRRFSNNCAVPTACWLAIASVSY